jgi:hypothetical protein
LRKRDKTKATSQTYGLEYMNASTRGPYITRPIKSSNPSDEGHSVPEFDVLEVQMLRLDLSRTYNNLLVSSLVLPLQSMPSQLPEYIVYDIATALAIERLAKVFDESAHIF